MCGSLSTPSKMPCHGYGLSAFKCRTGGKLALVPGSVCNQCYAMRGNYLYPSVLNAHEVRHAAILGDLTKWASDMVDKIRKEEHSGYFRWHDSGDLQSVAHLRAIMWIAAKLPNIQFWLPTKEYDWVRDHCEDRPDNLIVRVSHPMIGKAWPGGFPMLEGGYLPTSSVDSGLGYQCPAPVQGNKCGTCRACWDKSVVNVDYDKH